MTFRKSILLLISLSTIAALLACGGGSSTTKIISPPPPPPTPPLPDGTYVFSLAGTDTNNEGVPPNNEGVPYFVSGAFTIAGGAITGGEQDFTDFSLPIPTADLFDQINPTGSSATTTADGNLQITLVTCTGLCPSAPDPNIGPGGQGKGNGTEILNGTILPLSATNRTFINEFDAFGSASGELDTQSSTAALSGGYAFVLSGVDGQRDPLAVGGIVDVSGPGTISLTKSIFDINDDGDTFQGGAFGNASVAATPDSFGKVTFSLSPASVTQIKSFNMIGYIVDANRIFLLESANDNLVGTEGGIALSQSNGTVTNGGFTAANVAGPYVIGLNGEDTSNPPDAFQLVNQLTLSTAAPAVTGFMDFNHLKASSSQAFSPDPVTAGAYTVDAAGAGDVTISDIHDTRTNIYSLQLYLDGNGHALAISMDPTLVIAGVGFTQVGPFTAASFNGAYGLDVTGWDFNHDGEFDGVGPVKAVGSSGTFSGDVDLNWLNLKAALLKVADNTLTGTFAPSANPAAAAVGIFTGTVTGIDVTTCPAFTPGAACTADAFSYYLIDAAGDNIAIETDLNQATLGVFAQK